MVDVTRRIGPEFITVCLDFDERVNGHGRHVHDAADDNSIGEYFEIVVAPLAGWARRGGTLEEILW